MMTRKDFEQIAREFGWEFHIRGLRFDPSTGNTVSDLTTATRGGAAEDWLAGYHRGWEQALTTLRIAFQANNQRFDSERFMTAVNDFADLADKVGNKIFDQ